MNGTKKIKILHPGYSASNTLLLLPAGDGESGGYAHFATVQTAAAVIANNRFDGWLTTSRDGETKIHPNEAGLIPAGTYFFHVPVDASDGEEPYPIVPNFRSWWFPHNQLPSIWSRAGEDDFASEFLQTNDEPCRITGKILAREYAHIVPSSETGWFQRNEMIDYGNVSPAAGQAIDSPANRMRLRRDAHFLWDQMKFSIVPREDETQTVAWYTQIMAWHSELHMDWHARKLLSLSHRQPEYLFARFAWDLFPLLINFLNIGDPRRLAVRNDNGSVDIKTYNATECQTFTLNQGRGRSASPTKRQRMDFEQGLDEKDGGVGDGDEVGNSERKLSFGTSFDSGVDGMESPPADMDGDNPRKRSRRPSSPSNLPSWARNMFNEDNRGRPRCRID